MQEVFIETFLPSLSSLSFKDILVEGKLNGKKVYGMLW